MGRKNVQIPRRAAPKYLTDLIGDHYVPTEIDLWKQRIPPGHRFLLYFHGMESEAYAFYGRETKKTVEKAAAECDAGVFRQMGKVSDVCVPVKNGRRCALEACTGMGLVADNILDALDARAEATAPKGCWQADVQTIAPLVTGSGNPHPVENGFAFLAPYGVPYLAASGVKGVLRRVAEEMAVENAGGWTLVHIWALFGFDENSKWFRNRQLADEYEELVRKAAEHAGGLLAAWQDRIARDEARGLAPEDFALRLRQDRSLRRTIKWRGLLCFADAVPQPGAELMVDVLNPHHRDYYLKEGDFTPHDSENPVPVFFLALKPGACFTLRAWPLVPKNHEVLAQCGDWQALLNALVDRMTDAATGCGLGFGAKTSVGYGALVRDHTAEERRRQREEARRRAEEERRRREEEARRKAEEEHKRQEEEARREAEEERRRQEEEARRQAELAAMPPHERALAEAEDALARIRETLAGPGHEAYQQLRSLVNALMEGARGWDVQARRRVADWIEETLNGLEHGWRHPDLKPKKRKKWEQRLRADLDRLRREE